ncbi:hypothetical protein jhhlp_003259 [Lomentospora prolificans]|uniref:Protein farnesyltransferase subunit beta n=1 Tax=Lomentospora prolificans TaxID=41688 RepID=A0A2N3NGE3_9PEZI|nr:hypothetical protein jhhlp_003259 [Lomentospora prolificans]
MRSRARTVKARPRVQFTRRRSMATSSQSFPIRPASRSSGPPSISATSIPDLFTSQPIIRDPLETSTSNIQDETVRECLPYLRGNSTRLDYNRHGVPNLTREKHKNFLKRNLRKLPAPFIAADASRPWMLLWNLAGLALLDEDISSYGPVLVDTALTMQNRSGGFGGGHGQSSHLATTFACVLALACCGTQEAYDIIDRRSLWKWLCSLKQPNGGFQITFGGEVDVRGAYCAAVIITLLNIPLDLSPDSPAWTPERPTLFTGLADYVRRCQTFEGGISGQPDAEAHGAYAFCALGCLSILDAPHRIIPKYASQASSEVLTRSNTYMYDEANTDSPLFSFLPQRYLDVPRLISWLSSRQYAPEGGFSGRTNKLVDGCYSHWVGGCWPLIEACLNGPTGSDDQTSANAFPAAKQSLFNREGLIRYILCCCQDDSNRGGLRDKPGKPSDSYHTYYVLAGLSSAQHNWELKEEPSVLDNVASCSSSEWVVSPYLTDEQIFDERDRVLAIHPIYTIPQQKVNAIVEYFANKPGF